MLGRHDSGSYAGGWENEYYVAKSSILSAGLCGAVNLSGYLNHYISLYRRITLLVNLCTLQAIGFMWTHSWYAFNILHLSIYWINREFESNSILSSTLVWIRAPCDCISITYTLRSSIGETRPSETPHLPGSRSRSDRQDAPYATARIVT